MNEGFLGHDCKGGCRVCVQEMEVVEHVVRGSTGLTQRKYQRRHDQIGLRMYWELCHKYGVKCADVW